MPYEGLRDFLEALDANGRLRHVKAEVHKDWEIACILRHMFQRFPPEERFGLFFDNVKGYSIPVVAGVLGANPEVTALGLETTPSKIRDKWLKAFHSPIEPKIVNTGPCKDTILKGEKVDIFKFPVPVWTPGKDGGPFITGGCVVSKDPDTGVRNIGTRRLMVKERNKTGINFITAFEHGALHYAKHVGKKRAMEIAVAIGTDPAVYATASLKIPSGVDEYAVSGGLRGEPLELVKCETVDLEVPASAEIVLEGEILVDERLPEGPFGEGLGYMSEQFENLVFKINAITHRDSPIFHGVMSQMPPNEASCFLKPSREAQITKALRDLEVPGVVNVAAPEDGSAVLHIAVAIKKQGPAHPKLVMNAVWAVFPTAKHVVVTDEEVNIDNPFELQWAILTRVQPDKDLTIVPECIASPLDPSQGKEKVIGKIGIDATKKHPYPELALPAKELMDKAQAKWGEYDLPPLH